MNRVVCRYFFTCTGTYYTLVRITPGKPIYRLSERFNGIVVGFLHLTTREAAACIVRNRARGQITALSRMELLINDHY